MAAASLMLSHTIRLGTPLFNRLNWKCLGEYKRVHFRFLKSPSTIAGHSEEPPLPPFSLPSSFNVNFLMLFRWFHIIAGIVWIGFLYFFNLVNMSFMKELDPATGLRVLPGLMSRTLWWFRWGSVTTWSVGGVRAFHVQRDG